MHFLSSVCLRCARSTAHNSSLGHSCPDSCRGSRYHEWGPEPRRGPGRRGRGSGGDNGRAGPGLRRPRLGLQLTARPGHRCQAGHKGAFSRPAGGCLHRCAAGVPLARAGGRGAASERPGKAGRAVPGRAPLISGAAGHHPHASCRVIRSPGNPPGSGQPVPPWALPVTRTYPLHLPQASSLLGLSPPPKPAGACHARACGAQAWNGAFPSPGAGSAYPCLP